MPTEVQVIGGFAMYLNGISRTTEEVDVWMAPTHENGRRLICTLLGMGSGAREII